MVKTFRVIVLFLFLASFFFPSLSAQQARQKVNLIIKGGAIITMDADRRIIEDGFVAISRDKIVGIGKRSELDSRYTADKMIKAQGKAVLPGMINLHTHSFMVLFRGLADDHTLATWGQALGPLHRKNDDRPGFRKWGNYIACLEMIKQGTTTFVEMYHHPELLAEAATAAGLRAIVTLRLPFDRQAGKFDAKKAETAFEKFYKTWKGHPLITPGLAAHAPHTVPTEVLRFSKKLADKYDVHLVIHLAEGPVEMEQIKEKFGKTPTEYLDDLGFLSSRVLAVHCVRLTDEDIQIFKKRGVGVAHNPESNAKLCNGIARIPDLLKAGIKVGLGTDSAVSNNDLDIFEEMDMAVKLQRAFHQDWKVLTARHAFEMATIQGAAAIHMEKEIGSLEAGKKADIIIVGLDKAELQPVYDYYSHLVYVAKGADVETSIVDGRVIMERRKVLTLDVTQIKQKAEEYRRQVVQSMKK
ncbi:amidohydrolase [Acidobacteria bacterium AH-259-A15]|nr:amidohydrolase [Acidobacteria bacterium AH-259-A15]